MKKILLTLLLTLPLTATESSNRLYLGPDFFWDHLKYSNIKLDSYFFGLRGGYDYTRPNFYYFGTEALYALGPSHYRRSGDAPINQTHMSQFVNIEQRIGYTVASPLTPTFTIAPFGALGWYYRRLEGWSATTLNWLYIALGFRANQHFTETFDIGFRFKGFYSFAGKRHYNRWGECDALDNDFGYEADLPLTWHPSERPSWDVELCPYLLRLNTSTISQIIGLRLLAEYKF